MSGANRGNRFVGIALLVLLAGMTLLIARGIYSMSRGPQEPAAVQTASRAQAETPAAAPAASAPSASAQATSAPGTGAAQEQQQGSTGPTIYRSAM